MSIGETSVTQTVKNLPAMQETQVWAWGWEDPLEMGMCLPTPVLLPGEFHGQRSLVGYSPWGHKEVRQNWVTISLSLHFTFSSLSKRTGSRLFIGNDGMIKRLLSPGLCHTYSKPQTTQNIQGSKKVRESLLYTRKQDTCWEARQSIEFSRGISPVCPANPEKEAQKPGSKGKEKRIGHSQDFLGGYWLGEQVEEKKTVFLAWITRKRSIRQQSYLDLENINTSVIRQSKINP